jgi:hypothetical protein
MGIGSWFNQLSPPGKTRLVFAMTSVSTVAMFSIGWIVSSWPKDEDPSAFSRIVVVALVIIVATGVGLPYYVPSGVSQPNLEETKPGSCLLTSMGHLRWLLGRF